MCEVAVSSEAVPVDDFKHPFRNRSSIPVGPPVDVLSTHSVVKVR